MIACTRINSTARPSSNNLFLLLSSELFSQMKNVRKMKIILFVQKISLFPEGRIFRDLIIFLKLDYNVVPTMLSFCRSQKWNLAKKIEKKAFF
jgi:hypothetical protein